MVAVKRDGITAEDLSSDDPHRTGLVRELVRNTVTSVLQHSTEVGENADERDYFWRPVHLPPSKAVEDYVNDVRRLMFPASTDFRLDANNEFIDAATKYQYYRYQCTNQMHNCTHSCWKYPRYDSSEEKECRFHYPVQEDLSSGIDATIYTVYDSRKRTQTKVNPPRNNGWLNPLTVHPLPVFANQGNMDIQYISNIHGAVEYTCGYISKNDEPDKQMLINIFAKKLAQAILRSDTGDPTRRQQLRAAGNAIVASQQVGTVQCVYTLLKLPFVQLSRDVYTISAVPIATISKNIVTDLRQLEHMDPGDSTLSTSARSHAGRRLAYHLLCQNQYKQFGACKVSLFTTVSNYAISKPQRIYKNGTIAKIFPPKLIESNDHGEYIAHFYVNIFGD